ncbi:MAG: hypothetical protein LBU32_15765 [Clostridiales bacterium]|jgi:hypothetical protein|nr:hypothetical protein [Clostridiales bacterium]
MAHYTELSINASEIVEYMSKKAVKAVIEAQMPKRNQAGGSRHNGCPLRHRDEGQEMAGLKVKNLNSGLNGISFLRKETNGERFP